MYVCMYEHAEHDVPSAVLSGSHEETRELPAKRKTEAEAAGAMRPLGSVSRENNMQARQVYNQIITTPSQRGRAAASPTHTHLETNFPPSSNASGAVAGEGGGAGGGGVVGEGAEGWHHGIHIPPADQEDAGVFTAPFTTQSPRADQGDAGVMQEGPPPATAFPLTNSPVPLTNSPVTDGPGPRASAQEEGGRAGVREEFPALEGSKTKLLGQDVCVCVCLCVCVCVCVQARVRKKDKKGRQGTGEPGSVEAGK